MSIRNNFNAQCITLSNISVNCLFVMKNAQVKKWSGLWIPDQ